MTRFKNPERHIHKRSDKGFSQPTSIHKGFPGRQSAQNNGEDLISNFLIN